MYENTQHKKGWWSGSELQHEALNSNPSTTKKKNSTSLSLVSHACNPSYTGGRDLEDRS
jgi:hypothetical protein